MKLTDLHFRNFKSLLDISFQPGHVNVLIGPNGSGKTAILEAVGLCASTLFGNVDTDSLQRRGIRLSVPNLYKSKFREEAGEPLISFDLDWVDEKASGSGENTSHFSCHAGLVTASSGLDIQGLVYTKDHTSLYDSADFSQGEEARMWQAFYAIQTKYFFNTINAYLSAYGIYQPNTPVLRGTIPDPNQTNPIGLNGGRLAEALEDLIHKDEDGDLCFGILSMEDVLDMIDWMADMTVATPTKETLNANVSTIRTVIEFQDRYMDEKFRFTAYDASEGAMYVLFLLALAMHSDAPKVFAVDNFDQALNPRLAKRLTEVFCNLILEQKKQVFLTTHNPLVLDGLDLSNDDIRLFTVERDMMSGQTKVRRIQLDPKLLKEDQPLSRLWVNGLLGGVPNL